MKVDKGINSFIENRYNEIVKDNINKIEKLLNVIFLQEIKVICKFDWNIKDIILIFGDIEWFSHKSYKNMIFALKLYSRFFSFPSLLILEKKLSNIFSSWDNRWLDQYVWVSLISWKIVDYYWVIWGVKPAGSIININFQKDYYTNLLSEFPVIGKVDNGAIWCFTLNFSDNWEIIDKKIYFYEMSPLKFQNTLKNSFSSINNTYLKNFLLYYLNISIEDFWKEYICWSWYSYDNIEIDVVTLEFFLKSKKREDIFKNVSIFQSNFLEPYICQLFKGEIVNWFLVKESYIKRLNKGYYYYYKYN